MGLLNKIFGKNKTEQTTPKGFQIARITNIRSLNGDSVQITFDSERLSSEYRKFIPGQYITLSMQIEGKEYRRSYSICSTTDEGLSIGVKRLPNGKVSNYLTDTLGLDDTIMISKPEGNFQLLNNKGNFVLIAAGSGITPILSMTKTLEKSGGTATLFYGNRSLNQIMFKEDLEGLTNTKKHYFLSKEQIDGYQSGRLDTETLKSLFKENLALLRADGFYICGPEEMIKGAIDALKFYGVSDDKVHFELFTEAKLLKKETPGTDSDFEGTSKITLTLDGTSTEFSLNSQGQSILDAALNIGLDAPYSCRGGVCSTCRAKVLEGSVKMKNNLALTDKEIAQGYVLSCQSHPTSETLRISYDD